MKGLLAAALAVGVLADACGGSASSDQTLTAPSAAPSITETFTGTLDAAGTKSHNFTVGQAGEVDITLTAVGPPATISIGLGVGVPSESAGCVLISGFYGATQASTTPQIVGTAIAGPFCVSVYDVGNLANSVDYSITVAHP